MFDPKCYDLAEHFLVDETNVTAEHKSKLAQYIQNAIEEWLGYDPDAPREREPERNFPFSGSF